MDKLLRFIVIAALAAQILIVKPSTTQAATLQGPSDYITSDELNKTGVVHNAGFVIPIGGHDIIASDYIRVVLTNFSAVTAPTSGSGWGGVPVYGVNGNAAWVTGVTATAGGGIGISGITATNPAGAGDFDVTIEVAADINGIVVYDSATFDASVIKGISTATVSVSYYNSSIELFGFTSPAAFVTIMLNGSVAGTVVADSGGDFHKILPGLLQDTNYSVSIFAEDSQLRQTQTVSFIVHTLPYTNHIFSNIVIPTSIDIDKTEIDPQETLEIFGLAHPLSQVTVFVNSSPYSDVTQANLAGVWSYDFDSGDNPLESGGHVTYAKEIVIGGHTSVFTHSLQFNATACIAADINCDGYVNLTDFSIMLFYWNQTNPANSRADITGDNKVNLTDFSVMMFHWTG